MVAQQALALGRLRLDPVAINRNYFLEVERQPLFALDPQSAR